MTSPASPVTTATDVVFEGGTPGEPQSADIYTTSQAQPERIESVYMQVDTTSSNSLMDVFSLQLVSQAGIVLYEQATPPLLGVDNAGWTAFLTWSRLGNDTAQLPAFEHLFANDDVRRVWCNMRLPDLVLNTNCTVRLLCWVDDGGEGGPISVSNIAITVTRNAGAVSDTTSPFALTPLLLPMGSG